MARVVRAAGGVTQATLDSTTAALVTLSPATTARNVIQPSADVIPLTIRGKAGQTAALQRWEDSASGSLAFLSASGALSAALVAAPVGVLTQVQTSLVQDNFGNGAYLDLSTLTEARLIGRQDAVTVAVVGASGQAADLQQWRVNGGASKAGVTIDGRHRFIATNEQTTVGAFGAASALPVSPTKYLEVVDSTGATLVIPAYAA